MSARLTSWHLRQLSENHLYHDGGPEVLPLAISSAVRLGPTFAVSGRGVISERWVGGDSSARERDSRLGSQLSKPRCDSSAGSGR